MTAAWMIVQSFDVINRIATSDCNDGVHRIRFWRDGVLQSLSLAELDLRARCVAQRLRRMGVRRGHRIAVMASNRIEWVLIDLAVLKLGGVVAGFEPGRDDTATLSERYGLARLFVEEVQHDDPTQLDIDDVWAWSQETPDAAPGTRWHEGYAATDVCAIKFTSGSTGQPKGLEATVGSINDSLTAVQAMFHHGDGDDVLVVLQLALLQQRYWIYSALTFGHDLILSDLDDGLETARIASPTVVMGVPGIFDALRVRLEAMRFSPDLPAVRRDKIQAALGGRIRYLWTGSAPASRTLLHFFNDCGVPLYEGYGLNETCIVAKNHPGACRLGSVGQVLPNKTVRLDAQGILIVGSRNPVNRHYTWCAPGDNEKFFLPTREVRTNDLGHIDDDGFLYIHGRVDDIISLSSGRNVQVRIVEDALRRHPQVHECVLYGNGKPFLTAIVSPAAQPVHGAALGAHLCAINETLLPEQRVQRVVFTPERFSIDNGMLTSQLKPQRAEIHRRFADELDAIYNEPGARNLACPGNS